MCKKFIYVDTENTGYSFADILDKLDKTYNVRLIYTQFNDKMSVSYLQNFMNTKAKVDFIETKNGNANALDFCLIADVCYNASMSKKALHIVYSRDKGYSTAIEYLRNKGINMKIVESASDIIDSSLREEYDLGEYDYPNEFFSEETDTSIGLSIADIAFLKTKLTKIMSQFGVGVGSKGLDGAVFGRFMKCVNSEKEIDFDKLKSELNFYSKFREGGCGDNKFPLLMALLTSELSPKGFSLKAS